MLYPRKNKWVKWSVWWQKQIQQGHVGPVIEMVDGKFEYKLPSLMQSWVLIMT
jgi:hypothetical protein